MGKRVCLRRGQVVGYACGEGMTDVEIGVAAIDIGIRDRAWRADVVGNSIRRGNVNRVRPRIRCQRLQALRQTPLELDLQGVIVRSCGIIRDTDKLKIWIWIN